MSDGNSSTQRRQFFPEPAARERFLPLSAGLRNQIFDPLALALLGLALAVALWGFGSRLSQYGSPSDASVPHVPKARLWSEHPVGIAAIESHATILRLKPRAYVNSGAFAPIGASPKLILHEFPGMPSPTGRPRSIPFFHSAIPLRSPPSTYL